MMSPRTKGQMLCGIGKSMWDDKTAMRVEMGEFGEEAVMDA
jgi:hypothetical protein